MTAPDKIHQPGDIILDHYMPDATEGEREEARENLRALVRVLIRINRRLIEEAMGVDSPTDGR